VRDVESVHFVEDARQDPNGPVRVCAVAVGNFLPWFYFEPAHERARIFFDVPLPASSDATVRLSQYEIDGYLGNRSCDTSGGRVWQWKPLQATRVGPVDGPLDAQRLVFRDGEQLLGAVEFDPREPGQPLAWGLLPFAYVGDAVFATVGYVVTFPIYLIDSIRPPGVDPDRRDIPPDPPE